MRTVISSEWSVDKIIKVYGWLVQTSGECSYDTWFMVNTHDTEELIMNDELHTMFLLRWS